MTEAVCMPFSGFAGHMLMAVMGVLAVAICVVRYYWQHIHGEDRRPVRVYAYDMSKNAIAQSSAWIVNLVMTAGVFTSLSYQDAAEEELKIEGIGWYAAVFLMDFLIGVPVGIWLGVWLNHWSDEYWRSYLSSSLQLGALPKRRRSMTDVIHDELYDFYALDEVPPNDKLPCLAGWSERNRIYGKYGRHHRGTGEDIFVDAWGPNLDLWWWWSQLASWSVCVSISRVLSGMIMIALLWMHLSSANPVVWIAASITRLPLSCGQKQWLIAGFARMAIDVLQFLIIDAVNRFRSTGDHVELIDEDCA